MFVSIYVHSRHYRRYNSPPATLYVYTLTQTTTKLTGRHKEGELVLRSFMILTDTKYSLSTAK